jgi:hypothetical protein
MKKKEQKLEIIKKAAAIVNLTNKTLVYLQKILVFKKRS